VALFVGFCLLLAVQGLPGRVLFCGQEWRVATWHTHHCPDGVYRPHSSLSNSSVGPLHACCTVLFTCVCCCFVFTNTRPVVHTANGVSCLLETLLPCVYTGPMCAHACTQSSRAGMHSTGHTALSQGRQCQRKIAQGEGAPSCYCTQLLLTLPTTTSSIN
jgi:hypothetical protein